MTSKNSISFAEAYQRIGAEYLEMPGMRLTPQQVQRLSGFDGDLSRQVLDALVEACFLYVGLDGRYARRADGLPLRMASLKAELTSSVLHSRAS